jgi:hypothetical protein
MFYHVTPSGILAPLGGASQKWDAEFSVKKSILREYAEALFSYKKLERGRLEDGRLLTAYNLLSDPRIHSLPAAETAGDVKIRYTGLSVNLLTLRPEIHTLILVPNAD